jgi:hypothetical protein
MDNIKVFFVICILFCWLGCTPISIMIWVTLIHIENVYLILSSSLILGIIISFVCYILTD